MNTFKLKVAGALTGLFLLSSTASAEHCNVNFNYGVVIANKHVRILDHGQTIVQINNDQQLFIQGREIALNNEQLELIQQYSTGIRNNVPQIVSIAIEGVEIGLKAVNKVIGGLTGENSASHRKLQENFDEMQMRLRKKFNHSDENYYIAPQDFDDFDEIFAGEFEQEIEAIVSESIGTILMAVGEAMTNRDEETIEQRVDTFDERIESLGEDLKLEIGAKANNLEQRAEQFCHALSQLDQVESKLQQAVSEFRHYNLISSERNIHE